MGIGRIIGTLLRGAAHEEAARVVDANLVVVLDQQIRDAGRDLRSARHATAVAAVAVRDERRSLERTRSRIAELEARTVAALAAGDERLARDGAEEIARCEAAAERSAATLARAADRLAAHERIVDQGQARLDALASGRKEAAAAAAILQLSRRTGRGSASTGSLAAAEATLLRLTEITEKGQGVADALAWQEERGDVLDRLKAAGHGGPSGPDARAVLERLRPRAVSGNGN